MNIFAPELRSKIKKEVDFIPGAWVEFWDDLTVGILVEAQELRDSKSITTSIDLVVKQIADWNFEKDNTVLPINDDSIKLLSVKLLNWIVQAENEVLTEIGAEKKSPSVDSSSQPSQPTTQP